VLPSLLGCTSRGGFETMEWTKPAFVEVSMDTEVGRYQEDDGSRI
jgi:hypothetical protein